MRIRRKRTDQPDLREFSFFSSTYLSQDTARETPNMSWLTTAEVAVSLFCNAPGTLTTARASETIRADGDLCRWGFSEVKRLTPAPYEIIFFLSCLQMYGLPALADPTGATHAVHELYLAKWSTHLSSASRSTSPLLGIYEVVQGLATRTRQLSGHPGALLSAAAMISSPRRCCVGRVP